MNAKKQVRRERHRSVPLMPEIRHFKTKGLEIREKADTNEIVVTGQPIVYDEAYEVTDQFGRFRETMMPGVARDALSRGADVRFLINHEGLALARSTAGTMTFRDGSGGLNFEARLDARQQMANDLAIAIERGDCNAMSCAFTVAKDSWDKAQENRIIYSFSELRDISAVTFPCSPTTSLQIAQRMALELPVESRARLRRLYSQIRSGVPLTARDRELMAGLMGLELPNPVRSSGGVRASNGLRQELERMERQRRAEGRPRALPGPRRATAATRLVKAEDLRRAADEIKRKRRELAA